MKIAKSFATVILFAAISSAPLLSVAADTNAPASTKKIIPDKMTTCPVSGDKLDGDMGKPFVFEYKGQEVKLCCKDCKKDFDKNPAKYIKKIQDANKKAADKSKADK